MLTSGESSAIAAALEGARASLDRINAAYSEWRNALSYVWIEDAATRHMRELTEAARAEYQALVNEQGEIAASPMPAPGAVADVIARAERLAASNVPAQIEAAGRGANWSTIVSTEVREGIHGAGQVANAALDQAGKEVAHALPWWVWPVGIVVALAVLAPTLGPVVAALVASRKLGRKK